MIQSQFTKELRTLAIKMYRILNNLSPLFTRDMTTEICVLYNTRSTSKIEEDESSSSRCITKCSYENPGTKTVSYELEPELENVDGYAR